jgi:hypothetical protein
MIARKILRKHISEQLNDLIYQCYHSKYHPSTADYINRIMSLFEQFAQWQFAEQIPNDNKCKLVLCTDNTYRFAKYDSSSGNGVWKDDFTQCLLQVHSWHELPGD